MRQQQQQQSAAVTTNKINMTRDQIERIEEKEVDSVK